MKVMGKSTWPRTVHVPMQAQNTQVRIVDRLILSLIEFLISISSVVRPCKFRIFRYDLLIIMFGIKLRTGRS